MMLKERQPLTGVECKSDAGGVLHDFASIYQNTSSPEAQHDTHLTRVVS